MIDKLWKYVVLAIVVGHVIYFAWSWKRMVEQRLDAIGQGVLRKHPELGQPPGQRPEEKVKQDE